MKLERIWHKSQALLAFPDWTINNIVHGFSVGLDFDIAAFCGGVELIELKQTHRNNVVDFRGERAATRLEGDALVVEVGLPALRNHVFAIKTADCVPLIIRSADAFALVHAGWRGLANGVIENAIKVLGAQKGLTALIGPCADSCCYKVGTEVIAAIGDRAVVVSKKGDQYLSTAGTARAILEASCINVITSNICTICDSRFHSYRRMQGDQKSNYCLLKI